MTFDVLGAQRTIRDDKALSSTDAWILICAVLRTDNKTTKVRYSLEGLAVDAKVSRKTVVRAFQKPEVLKYFKTVERTSRRVDLWFYESMRDMVSLNTDEGLSVRNGNEGHGVHNEGHTVLNEGQEVTPSTCSSTLSSTNAPVGSTPTVTIEVQDQIQLGMKDESTSSNKISDEPAILPNVVSDRPAGFVYDPDHRMGLSEERQRYIYQVVQNRKKEEAENGI